MNDPFDVLGLSRQQLQQMQEVAERLRAAQPAIDAMKAAVAAEGPAIAEMRRNLAEAASRLPPSIAERASTTATLLAKSLRPLAAADLTPDLTALEKAIGRHPGGSVGNEIDHLVNPVREQFSAAFDFTKPKW